MAQGKAEWIAFVAFRSAELFSNSAARTVDNSKMTAELQTNCALHDLSHRATVGFHSREATVPWPKKTGKR
jgi:hypothetical protein